MNNIVPYDFEPPATELQARPYQPERFSLRYIVGVILSRAWPAIGIGVALFLLVIGFVSQIPRTYYAEGAVLIQPRRANLTRIEQQTDSYLPTDTSAVDTQVEVLRSRAMAEEVVKRLKLYDDPEFNSALDVREPAIFYWDWPIAFEIDFPFAWSDLWPFSSNKPEVATNADNSVWLNRTTIAVQNSSFVRRVGLTYVVRVGFGSHDPDKARTIADEFITAYMDRQLDEKVTLVQRANTDLDGSVAKLRQEALDAEASAQEYKNRFNLTSIEGTTMAEAEVSNLNRQIAEARADRAEKEARVAAAIAQVRRGGGGADVGAALTSDTIRELRAREAETSIQLAQLTVRFKDDYPEVRRTQAQLNDIRDQIQSEINRILSSLRSEAQAAAQREVSLTASRQQAQNGLASSNRARVGLVALQQRADTAKKLYEGYLTRASEVAVERTLQQPDATVEYRAAIAPWISPDPRMTLVFATFLAILGGIATLLIAEFWSRRLRSRHDVEGETGLPLAGVIPDASSIARLPRRRYPAGAADYLVEHPFTALAESFRNLRAFLMLSTRSGPAKVIAVTSAVPREGKSMTSLCLARTLALTGSKVVLIDCDLRRRGATKLVGESDIGIVEVIEDKFPVQRALIRDTKSNCWILPASSQRDIPHDLFGRPETDEMFRSLSESFDFVILDAPPLLGVADARILAAKADRVLYVVQWNKTPASAAQSAVEILQDCGAKVAGAILSKVDVKKQARYGYGDASDYFTYYRHYYLTNA
jgi:capsular exopolysaccharide synthesis family protein